MRKRSDFGHAAILFVLVIFAAAFCVAAFGCQTIAGIGRDMTAWADGGSRDASDNARAIRASAD
jgi:predicted small secreted protein